MIYIDADKLKDIKFNSISNDKYGIYRMGWNDAIDAVVDNEPTADVVEVVRCKDCKYAEVADAEDSQDGYICQFHRGCIWFSGSYCSWAERKES